MAALTVSHSLVDNVSAVGHVASSCVLLHGKLCHLVQSDVVGVVHDDEVVEAFLDAAIAVQSYDSVAEDSVCAAVGLHL
jgi:hypothetical protein